MKDPDKSLCFCLTRITVLYQATLLQTAGAQHRVQVRNEGLAVTLENGSGPDDTQPQWQGLGQ